MKWINKCWVTGLSGMNARKMLRIMVFPAALFLGLVLMVSACSYTEGYAVDDYLKNVSRIQYSSDYALLGMSADLNDLGATDLKAVEATTARLKAEQDQIIAAREQLDQLDAPESASTLKSHLLDLYAQGAENIGILAASGDYRLATEPLMGEYESVSKTFSEKVKTANDQTSLVACLQDYENALLSISEKLKPIVPSMLSVHSHQRFIDNLNTLQAGLGETIDGLEGGDRAKLDEATAKMAAIDGGGADLRHTIRTEREADIRQYNAKIKQMSELMSQIGQDQLELHQRFDRQ
ncbi:MAG: hypothetical protein M1455_11800 [Actinobacteria bacterium]|nr:hypothetical protein [Actinomycetota bacterium]